jgi:hypothetical protein
MEFLRIVTKDLRFILFQRCSLCGIYGYLRIQLYDLQIYKSPSTLHRLALFLHVPTPYSHYRHYRRGWPVWTWGQPISEFEAARFRPGVVHFGFRGSRVANRDIKDKIPNSETEANALNVNYRFITLYIRYNIDQNDALVT